MNLVWDNALPWLLILAIAAGLGGILFFSYRKPRRPLPRPLRMLLLALRLGVVVIVFLLLARPVLEGKRGGDEKNALVFLIDASKSMTTKDEGSRSRFQATRDAFSKSQGKLEDLREKYDVSLFRFGSDLRQIRDVSFEPADSHTRLGSALAEALRRTRPGALEQVVLVSDGRNNGGRDPQGQAYAMKRKGIRLHTVAAGKPRGSADYTNVIAGVARGPEEVNAGKIFEISAEFLAVGAKGEAVDVDLSQDGRPLGTVRRKVLEDHETLRFTFNQTFVKEGIYLLGFTARPVKGESTTRDNTLFLPVKVRRKVLEVLYIEGQARDECKYIRRSLSGFQDLKLTTLLSLTDDLAAEALPGDLAGWLKYDVVILGDLPARALSREALRALERAVGKGLGFVMIGGYESFGAGGYGGTPVADLLPVRVGEGENRTDVLYPLEPTEQGFRTSVLRLSESDEESRSLWRSLAKLKGCSVALPKGRGETVLARGPGGAPILVSQDYGSGRSMAFLADTTWRWWRSAGGREDLHKRFWRQMTLWLARREGAGRVRLHLEKTTFDAGEEIRLRAEVRDNLLQPVDGATVVSSIERPDAKKEELGLEADPEGYSAAFTPKGEGRYRIRVRASRGGFPYGEDVAEFVVRSRDRELQNPFSNRELLANLAGATGGESTDLSGLPALLVKISGGHREIPAERAVAREIWTSPWIFLFFSLLLCGEWAIRRWQGFP